MGNVQAESQEEQKAKLKPQKLLTDTYIFNIFKWYDIMVEIVNVI